MRPMPTTLALGKINVSYRASYLLGLGKALIFIFIVNLNNRPPKLILSLVHIALTVLDWTRLGITCVFAFHSKRKTRSSAMAEGLRYVHVGIEKSLQSRITLVITVAAIKWPYGISLPVCRIICVNLRLAVLIQYRSVMERQTDRHTHRHTTTVYTALSIASRGNHS